MPRVFKTLLLPLFFLMLSCSKGPEPIVVGRDVCEYCKMVIADKRFAAEVITKKGRVYKFDAIECMIAYYNENEQDIRSAYVVDFNSPNTFLPAESAYYVRSEGIRSPMGMNLSAFKSKEEAERAIREAKGGEILDFGAVRNLVKKEYKFSH